MVERKLKMPSIRNGQLDYNSSNISVPKFTPVENPLVTFMDLRDDRAKNALAEKQAAEDRAQKLKLIKQADDDRAKKLAADKALVEYASTPFNTNRALDTQRALADQALLEDSANRLAKYEASLKEHNVTQDDVNKGRVSQAILDKIANPGLDVDRASSINNVYSNITPQSTLKQKPHSILVSQSTRNHLIRRLRTKQRRQKITLSGT